MPRKGFQNAVYVECAKEIRSEIKACKKKELTLAKPVSLATLRDFDWQICVDEVTEEAPRTMALLRCMLSPTDMYVAYTVY
jgi:hypothetical protein